MHTFMFELRAISSPTCACQGPSKRLVSLEAPLYAETAPVRFTTQKTASVRFTAQKQPLYALLPKKHGSTSEEPQPTMEIVLYACG